MRNWVNWSGSWKKKINIEAESMLCISPRLLIIKRGCLIERHMAHWRNITKNETFLISIFNSFLNQYSCLNISFKMFKYIWFESFLLMIKNSKSVLLLQKNNWLFPRNNRLFCVWQHCEGMDLISFWFLAVADHIDERILGQWSNVESWLCSERSYNMS